ncbi:hypothetical protein V5799_012932 [Amblyomma americanum]|uniref:Uncharacterized protein n=1 Tax=Amblyomma americanum TaxID=6943 RepID=A0AAQ4E7J8_AMBAM
MQWTNIASKMQGIAGRSFTVRAVRDRTEILLGHHAANDRATLNKSGTEEQYQAREVLLQEVLDLAREHGVKLRARRRAYLAPAATPGEANCAPAVQMILPRKPETYTPRHTSTGAPVTMAYAIVEFTELDQVEDVPALWIEDNKCAWPEKLKGDRVTSMVKKAVIPDVLWKWFEITVKGLFATYDKARKKLERSQYTSELGSDSETPNRKRIRRPPPQWLMDKDTGLAPAKKMRRRIPAVPSSFPQGLHYTAPKQSSSEGSEGK